MKPPPVPQSPSSLARERGLLRAARHGDRRARDRLARDHLTLVRSVAGRYRGLGLSFDDLVQEGALGLLDAIERFDGRRSDDFRTFARWRIRRAILNALTKHGRLVRLPKQVVEGRRALARLDEQAIKSNGHSASAEELATATGLSAAAVGALREAPHPVISLDGRPDDGLPLERLLVDPAAADPEVELVNRERAERLAQAVEGLPVRQQHVVRHHFGLGSEAQSLAEIGGELHLSPQRVRALERAALHRLATELDPLRTGGI